MSTVFLQWKIETPGYTATGHFKAYFIIVMVLFGSDDPSGWKYRSSHFYFWECQSDYQKRVFTVGLAGISLTIWLAWQKQNIFRQHTAQLLLSQFPPFKIQWPLDILGEACKPGLPLKRPKQLSLGHKQRLQPTQHAMAPPSPFHNSQTGSNAALKRCKRLTLVLHVRQWIY